MDCGCQTVILEVAWAVVCQTDDAQVVGPSACLLEKNKDGIVEADSDLAFMLAWLRDPSFP